MIQIPSWLEQILEHRAHFTVPGIHGLIDRWWLTNHLGEKLSNDPSFAAELEAFLDGYLVMVSPDEIRLRQARQLFDLGFGGEGVGFETYLEGIPEITASLVAFDHKLPLLFLADPRLGVKEACRLININFIEPKSGDECVGPCDERHHDPTKPFWFRCSNGRSNRKRNPIKCRKECVGTLLAGTVLVGVMTFAHKQNIIDNDFGIDLPGSAFYMFRNYCACLMNVEGRPTVVQDRCANYTNQKTGSLFFRLE